MKHVTLLLVASLGLLTYLLYFEVHSFPLLDRPASFLSLFALSVIVLVISVFDSVVKAKADLSIGWNAFAITGATLLTLANLFIWFVGGVLA